MLTFPLVSEATPPYAFCACADDILSSPRPIRTARLIAKKRPISLPPGVGLTRWKLIRTPRERNHPKGDTDDSPFQLGVYAHACMGNLMEVSPVSPVASIMVL